MVTRKLYKKFLCLLAVLLIFGSCKKEETATKLRMQGNWELTSAVDANGQDIRSKVAFPVTVMQLTDDNGMVGTIGPMFMYLVYGDSHWVDIAASIDQVFDYANLRFNTGEFFVDPGVQERFTVEPKLQATAIAGGGGLIDLLTLAGVDASWLQQTIYHKFTNVRVSFANDRTMTWEFDDAVQPFYNYKDGQGNYVVWNGIPVNSFTRATFTFSKRTQTVTEIVEANQ